ncbi:MAG: VWA domain-containing protein [Clostridia bacterium]|nr:VWA domain-containing protein [Clostridia bacterium]
MSFYFPLGLLGLLGIPVLILIYIIKSKYTEQTIASTYLWDLSERFLKKRKPISKLTGILTLILQILAVIAISLLIAHPVFVVRNSANDIYFILDGSASMNMQQGGSTRFEKAQDRINKIIDGSLGGSSYTLIFVRDTADVAFEAVTDKEQAKANVNGLSAGWGAGECASAMSLAQNYFDANNSALIYLLTDKPYDTVNMTLIDVSTGEQNYALVDYDYTMSNNGEKVVVNGTGKVISYQKDASITVELSYAVTPGGATVKAAETVVSVKAGEPTEFTIKAETPRFAYLQYGIAENDALGEDNIVVLYDEAKAQARQVLIVSDSEESVYIKNAISGAGKASVEMMDTATYKKGESISGYGLYVFNGYSPETLPKNAAIWLIDAVDGSNKETGITFRDYAEKQDTTGPGSYFTPRYSKSTPLVKGLLQREVAVRKYAVYGLPRNFTTVMSVDIDPIVAVGLNANNDREVVFSFRIGDSNFGMMEDFLILVRNLMNYSFPSVIDETSYYCGEVMEVNVVPGCENIVVTAPSGKSTTLDTLDKAMCEVQLNETGTYVISVRLTGSEEETKLYAFASVPEAESRSEGGGALYLSGTKDSNYSDGFYDDLLAFFILIALFLLADWGVYCYEQHQL